MNNEPEKLNVCVFEEISVSDILVMVYKFNFSFDVVFKSIFKSFIFVREIFGGISCYSRPPTNDLNIIKINNSILLNSYMFFNKIEFFN